MATPTKRNIANAMRMFKRYNKEEMKGLSLISNNIAGHAIINYKLKASILKSMIENRMAE